MRVWRYLGRPVTLVRQSLADIGDFAASRLGGAPQRPAASVAGATEAGSTPVTATRRNLLMWGAAGGAGALAAGAGVLGLFGAYRSTPQFVEAIVRQKLNYVEISRADLQAFADDFTIHLRHWVEQRGLGKQFLVLRSFYTFTTWGVVESVTPARIRERINLLEEDVVSQFLLSTDFFEKEDPGTGRVPVEYLGFYDPYSWPCRNPLAQFEA